MTSPSQILTMVRQAGGSLERVGDRIRVVLPINCCPALKNAIRQHKSELLDLLNTHAPESDDNGLVWLHTAKQILAGEFEGLTDRAVFSYLQFGLRNKSHPLCQQALLHINQNNQTKEQ